MFFFKYYFIRLLSLCDFFIYKKNNTVCFSSFPDFSDNAFGLFVFMTNNYENRHFIWLVSDIDQNYNQLIKHYVKKDINLTIIKKNSLKGFLYYCSSKYVFFTHGVYPGAIIPKNHILVNLWHGMPLKNIGYLDGLDSKYIPNFTYGIATSRFYQKIMAQAFKKNKKNILLSGQPRNDFLFYENKEIKDVIFKFFLKENMKNIIWLPTYRKSMIGDIRNDGEDFDVLPGISEHQLKLLDNFLVQNHLNLIIKLHPMDKLNQKSFTLFKNINILKNKDLDKLGVNLYTLLKYTDILVTDYSSIYIDYMLMEEKKIIFFVPDFDKYSNSRGFIFNDFKVSYLPGEVVKTFNTFCQSLISKYKIDFKKYDIYHDIDINNYSQSLLDGIGFKRTVFILGLPSFYKINLLNEIAKKENIFIIFLSSGSTQRNKDFVNLETIKFDYEIIGNNKIQERTFLEKLQTIVKLYYILKKINYDSLVVNEWSLLEYWISLLLSLKQKKIFILESSINESKTKGITKFIKKVFLSQINIVLPSGIAHQKLLNKLHFKGKSFFTNGVGILNKHNIKKQNYQHQPTKFLYVGRLIKLKNIEFLINIFNEMSNYTLNIVGDGKDEGYLKSIAKENINFLGYIPNKEIGEIFIENDVFILPSFKEPWGLVVEEAIYYGLPLIVSQRVGSSDYYVKEKKTGEIFEPNSKESFLKALNKIVENYSFYVENVKKVSLDQEIDFQVSAYLKAIND